MSIISTVAGIGAVVALLSANATQGGRNAAAQADLARSEPIPAFARAVNAQIAAYAAAAGPNAPAATAAAAGVNLQSVGFDFPASDRAFPPGENVDVVTNNCTACHLPGMILNQPKLSAVNWTAEVNKMRGTYKAPMPDDAVPQIVSYLAALSPSRNDVSRRARGIGRPRRRPWVRRDAGRTSSPPATAMSA